MAMLIQHNILPPADMGGQSARVLILCAPYYADIAEMLVQGAQTECDLVGAAYERIDVPGALEVPPAIQTASRMADFDAYVALGCIIRGETTHYETVCNDSSRGLMDLGLRGLAIGNGILTVENYDQAMVRANPMDQNKGGGAARAALHLLALQRRFKSVPKGMGFRPRGENILVAGNDDGSNIA
ncbi:MAG: 6,7-dimethyl-8-ribityllumazine synthase [Pseudomonadota bacterium]